MKYLIKTNELLLEPSFLKFARQVYEGFISLDEVDYQHAKEHGHTFEMTLNRWYQQCNANEPTRVYSGATSTFKEYAGHCAKGRIRKDWQNFEDSTKEMTNKAKEEATKELLLEVGKVREVTKIMPFLEPIQKMILEGIESILHHYQYPHSQTRENTGDMNQSQNKLKWRGGASALCALFLDLRTERMKKTEDKYLSVGDAQLVQFIFDNFEFRDNMDEVEHISQATIKRYVEGKDIAKRIRLDFSDITK